MYPSSLLYSTVGAGWMSDRARLRAWVSLATTPSVPVTVIRRLRPQNPDIAGGPARGSAQASRIAGNSTTSRIDGRPVSSITRRSMPMPMPPVGGIPSSSASM